jgi:hypothetical protein
LYYSSDRPRIRININNTQIRDYFFGSNKLVFGAKLISSFKMFLSIVNSSRPNKYYTCHLGEIMVSINNKIIINRNIPSSEVRVLSIVESIFF